MDAMDRLIAYLDRSVGLRDGMPRDQRLDTIARMHLSYRWPSVESRRCCEFSHEEIEQRMAELSPEE